MKYPNNLEIPENVVQQIQISHDFVESKITITEKDWNSISYYNADKQIVIVLVLDKYDVASDFPIILEEFNKELELDLNEKELKEHMERIFNLSLTVFRVRDEVISKLSNELADLKMRVYDYEKKLEKIAELDFLSVKSRILFLLANYDELNFQDIKKSVKTSKQWLESVIETLLKNKIIKYDSNKDTYYVIF